MKFGVPTIASEVGGLRSIYQHEQNGLLVEGGNPTLLADAIIRLGTNHVLQGGWLNKQISMCRLFYARSRAARGYFQWSELVLSLVFGLFLRLN